MGLISRSAQCLLHTASTCRRSVSRLDAALQPSVRASRNFAGKHSARKGAIATRNYGLEYILFVVFPVDFSAHHREITSRGLQRVGPEREIDRRYAHRCFKTCSCLETCEPILPR